MDRREVKTEGSGVGMKKRSPGRPSNFNASVVTKHLIIQHTGKREHIVVEKDEDLGQVARSQTGYLRNNDKTGYLKSSETRKEPRPLPWKQRSPRSRVTPRPVQVYDVEDEDDDDPQPISTEIDSTVETSILPDQPADGSRLTDDIDP